MVCSPVMHSNLARLVVTLSLPWAWQAPAAAGVSGCAGPASGRLLPAHCLRPAQRAASLPGGGCHCSIAAQLLSLSRGRPTVKVTAVRVTHSA